jgi:3',5'-cyclic AMP phosphodiesterase CpdA
MFTRIFIYITTILLVFSTTHSTAQINLQTIEFYGIVHENGKGIQGVPVTDGINIVLTDKEGNFELFSNTFVEFIYITIPSGYNIPIRNNSPHFFHHIQDKSTNRQNINFELKKSIINDDRHTMIVCADPQVAFDEELPLLQTVIDDMKKLTSHDYPNSPVFGMICGDIIADIKNEPKFFSSIKQMFNNIRIPFFYVAGNHDMDITGRSNYRSKKTFEDNVGPSYYSFNRGKIHYVVLDDVFFTGKAYGYIGYLDERQLNWLEQDLTLVPQRSTVVITLHIPTYSREARQGEYAKEEINKVLQNRRALYKMLEPFNAHIMSGHEHYNENYIINDHIFEHVHAALCGIFWQAPYSSDGTPLGYSVYEVDGSNIQWYYKVAGKDKNVQFNAYLPGADMHKPDAIIANVWNYDPVWKVFWYENGVRMGEMTQYKGWDPAIVDYVEKNNQNFRYKYIGAGPTEHLFYAEPIDKTSEIEVEVIDRFNNSYISKLQK